jgi:hypothetical protein
MRKALYTTLVATQLMGAWLATPQTNTNASKKQQQSLRKVNISLVHAGSRGSTSPVSAFADSVWRRV